MKKDRTGGKRENWLLIKKRDAYAGDGDEPTETFDTSIKTGRTMKQIETGEDSAADVRREEEIASTASFLSRTEAASEAAWPSSHRPA